VNRLRSLENVEAAFYLDGGAFNIFSEMHRIAQRRAIRHRKDAARRGS
jgi:hypothetical protein